MTDSTRGTGSERALRVLLAHDDRLELYALEHALQQDEVEVVGEAHTMEQVPPLTARTRPDVVLLADRLAADDDFATIAQLKDRHANTRIIVLEDGHEDATARAACAAGAAGFVSTAADPHHLAALLIEAAAGTVCVMPTEEVRAPIADALTERELTVLRGAARGLSNAAIGQELWLSQHTVKSHLHRIYAKLAVANRTEATRWAVEHRILEQDLA